MRCVNCHGTGHKWSQLTQQYLFCIECNGSGITSCCEGNPNMTDPQRPMYECDVEIHRCPACAQDVVVYVELDGTGVISHESYDLIANWVYHSKCWDEMMRRFPPGESNG